MHKKILNFEIFNIFFVDNQETLLYFLYNYRSLMSRHSKKKKTFLINQSLCP